MGGGRRGGEERGGGEGRGGRAGGGGGQEDRIPPKISPISNGGHNKIFWRTSVWKTGVLFGVLPKIRPRSRTK